MINKKEELYSCRYLARIVLEANTPIIIGSGEKNNDTDKLVQKDVNGLPYLPASSVAGCLRHAVMGTIDNETEKRLFGFQNGEDGRGSQLVITDGRIVGPKGVVDGIVAMDSLNDSDRDFFSKFEKLPIRDHVRLSHRGGAEKGGKFDEEIVYKGTRFCFEIEFVSCSDQESKLFDAILEKFSDLEFRIGAGSRSGFGKVSVVSLQKRLLDLRKPEDRDDYLCKSSSLADSDFWSKSDKETPSEKERESERWTQYTLELTARDFFLFGSGSGNADADICNATSEQIEWMGDIPKFSHKKLLIPGSSVKGAISHRVAFYYNKRTGVTIESLKQNAKETGTSIAILMENSVSDRNMAVRTLFGSQDPQNPACGNVLISDAIEDAPNTKLLNHVAVDRFTGGAIEGALFAEEPWANKVDDKCKVKLEFLVKNTALTDENVKGAFEDALKAVACGELPLGGGTNRGHGVFNGNVLKNGEALYEYHD